MCLINIILFNNPPEAAEISYINLVSDSILFIVDDERRYNKYVRIRTLRI